MRETTVDAIFPILTDENGTIDVHSDFWAGNQPENLTRYVERRRTVHLNERPYPGRQGLYVPAAVADRFGLSDLADLADPEVSAAFDTNGDGRGEIWIGAPGWRSTRATEDLLRSYGIWEFWEAQEFSDTILKAKLRQFHAQDRPIVFYGFEPDWIHAAYDLRALLISPQNGRCPNVLGIVPLGDGCAFEPVAVHLAYAARLEATYPDAARLIRSIAFRTIDVNAWLALLADGDLSPAEIARQWRDENPHIIAAWRARAVQHVDDEDL